MTNDGHVFQLLSVQLLLKVKRNKKKKKNEHPAAEACFYVWSRANVSACVFLVIFILFWKINAGKKPESLRMRECARGNTRSFFVVLNYLVKRKMRRGNPYTQLLGYGRKKVPHLLHVFR